MEGIVHSAYRCPGGRDGGDRDGSGEGGGHHRFVRGALSQDFEPLYFLRRTSGLYRRHVFPRLLDDRDGYAILVSDTNRRLVALFFLCEGEFATCRTLVCGNISSSGSSVRQGLLAKASTRLVTGLGFNCRSVLFPTIFRRANHPELWSRRFAGDYKDFSFYFLFRRLTGRCRDCCGDNDFVVCVEFRSTTMPGFKVRHVGRARRGYSKNAGYRRHVRVANALGHLFPNVRVREAPQVWGGEG